MEYPKGYLVSIGGAEDKGDKTQRKVPREWNFKNGNRVDESRTAYHRSYYYSYFLSLR